MLHGSLTDDLIVAKLSHLKHQHPSFCFIDPLVIQEWRRYIQLDPSNLGSLDYHPLTDKFIGSVIYLNNNHWGVFFIDTTIHKAVLIDSMKRKENIAILEEIVDTFVWAFLDKSEPWEIEVWMAHETQIDAVSCGVRSLAYVEAILAERQGVSCCNRTFPTVTQHTIQSLRERYTQEIFQGESSLIREEFTYGGTPIRSPRFN